MTDSIHVNQIRLEVSSRCQLRCPSCPTTTGAINPAVGSGALKFADFKALLDSNPKIREVELSNYGEIFLNPELISMLEYAYKRHIRLTAFNGVNLNHVKPEVLEALVKYRLWGMSVSLDGASQETYKVYRVRGNFDRVIENLKQINAYKKHYGSQFPILTWQFVVFGHNEHEISVAREMATKLEMTFNLKLTWDDSFSPIRDAELVRREVGNGAVSREEYRQNEGSDYMSAICNQLWDRPQINWDGRVLGCCRNFWGDFGANAFREGLNSALNSERMRYARGMLTGKNPPRPDIPCTSCEIYLAKKESQVWHVPPPAPHRLRRLWQRLRVLGAGLRPVHV